jgi:NADPH2:quinone reductase
MKQTIQKTMRAVAIDHFGGLDTLKVKEINVPEVDSDEILIHVVSAGIGQWDPFEREGGFSEIYDFEPTFPYVLGSDGAGTVITVGDDVKRFKEGDRVYGVSVMNPKGGFYAEYTAIKADDANLVPDNLTIEQAGVMPVDAITALQGLDDALNLESGESILIFGASGGIGHLAVQFAKRIGARVFAVASGEDGVKLVKKLGADAAVDGHRDKDNIEAAARKFEPGGIDCALLTAGGKAAEEALAALHEAGFVVYPNGVEPEPQIRSDLSVETYDGEPNPQVLSKLNELIESGPFEVHIARTFTLDQVAEAHRSLEKHYLGKLALRPS